MAERVDIVAFLTARLDEDQAAAEAEPGGSWYGPQVITDAHGRPRWRIERSPFGSGVPIADCFEAATALHLLRHHPAHVLRKVAATRRILAVCDNMRRGSDPDGETLAEITLCELAGVYDEHPDYDPNWRME